ncbi:hypothetical protein EN895_33720, partial [Mesorhizobium sp. M7A.F.Ca.CA.002.03.2.1]
MRGRIPRQLHRRAPGGLQGVSRHVLRFHCRRPGDIEDDLDVAARSPSKSPIAKQDAAQDGRIGNHLMRKRTIFFGIIVVAAAGIWLNNTSLL